MTSLEDATAKACGSKHVYTTRRAAKRAVKVLRARYLEPNLFAYWCPVCNQYHIGHGLKIKGR